VRLDQTDYTASSGTSIVLASAAALNDELNIVAFGTFSVASINGVDIINGTVSANKLASGAAVSNIGYTPVNKAGDTMTGELVVTSLKGVAGNKLQLRSGDASYGVSLQNISGVDLLAVDAVGRVTTPYQPGWSAFATTGANLSTSGTPAKMPYTTEVTDTGGHYDASISRFTAPVAGKYFVSFSALALGGGGMNLKLYKNGALFSGANGHARSITGTNEQNMGQSVVVSLAANDYLEIFYNNDGASNQIYGAHGSFCGYLLG